MSNKLHELAVCVGDALQNQSAMLTTAESCTGGWIAKVITDIPGSSGWFDCGFVTYSNEAKMAMLGVQEATLSAHGAVSAETVTEMVAGALAHSRAEVAVAVSGIAGPDGGSLAKPVGTVWLAWARRGGAIRSQCQVFSGDREAVRQKTVITALQEVLNVLDEC